MKSERVMLQVGELYELHTDNRNHKGQVLECLRVLPNDYYSPFSAVVRSTITGWTMMVHGTNGYEDGSIDWDFSTNGYFSTKGV